MFYQWDSFCKHPHFTHKFFQPLPAYCRSSQRWHICCFMRIDSCLFWEYSDLSWETIYLDDWMSCNKRHIGISLSFFVVCFTWCIVLGLSLLRNQVVHVNCLLLLQSIKKEHLLPNVTLELLSKISLFILTTPLFEGWETVTNFPLVCLSEKLNLVLACRLVCSIVDANLML